MIGKHTLCNCPAGFSAEADRHAPDCPGRSGAGKPALAAVTECLTVPALLAMPAGLHPDTQDLITRFATALAVKLHGAEQKYGYSNAWKDQNWMDECRQKLVEHLAKGDPRDVAAYCAFLWHHCESTAPCLWMGTAAQPASPAKSCIWKRDWETGAYQLGCCDQVWHFTDGTVEENGAKFCHRCAGEIVVERRQLIAYQVGDNDIVAAYDTTGAIQVLEDFTNGGYDFDEDDVELVSDKMLDNTEVYDQDEGKIVTLDKTLRQELAELTEPAYLHGWE